MSRQEKLFEWGGAAQYGIAAVLCFVVLGEPDPMLAYGCAMLCCIAVNFFYVLRYAHRYHRVHAEAGAMIFGAIKALVATLWLYAVLGFPLLALQKMGVI